MYKGTSRSLQRAHGVSGTMAGSQPSDELPAVGDMTLEDLQSERALLIHQKAQLEIEVKAQRSAGRKAPAKGAGYRIQTLCARLSEVNAQIKLHRLARNADRDDALLEVVEAVRAHLPPDGIPVKEFVSRVVAAVDNERINPIIAAIEARVGKVAG